LPKIGHVLQRRRFAGGTEFTHPTRVPAGPDWKQAPVGTHAVILEHADPDAWFDGRLVPLGGYRSSVAAAEAPIPELVERARADFAEILFTEAIRLAR
jgi:hypothetical protein